MSDTDDKFTFSDAMIIFCNQYCRLRAMRGDPVYLSEFAQGLTLMMVSLLDSLEGDNWDIVRVAVKSALDGNAKSDKGALN